MSCVYEWCELYWRHRVGCNCYCVATFCRLSLDSQMSFGMESLFCRAPLQKRPDLLRSLLIVAAPLGYRHITAATCCNPQQHTSRTLHTDGTKEQAWPMTLQHSATHCNALQRTATHFSHLTGYRWFHAESNTRVTTYKYIHVLMKFATRKSYIHTHTCVYICII